ncbi:MAG: CPBP family intramembrane metalloprotease, partial [Clostridiales bacterium]|nr:CPBP family intramembrane metalloprotease [Clostridiales bacterium]
MDNKLNGNEFEQNSNEWHNAEVPNDSQNPTGSYDAMLNSTLYNPEVADFEQMNINSKKILSRIGLAMSIMAAAILLSQVIISNIIAIAVPNVQETDWYIWALTAVSMYGFGLPVIYLLTRKLPNSPKKPVKKLKIHQFIIVLFISVAAMYLTNLISVFLNLILTIIKGKDILNPALDAIFHGNFILTFLYAAIGAPIVEELIFRKILLDKVRRFGDIPAILITGIAFGLFHMNIAQMFYATVLGFIFAYVTIRTNTIRYAVLLHILINAFGSTIVPFIVRNGNRF